LRDIHLGLWWHNTALRSTPTDAVDACADLLLFHLLVRRLLFHSATRLTTLPSNHPLFKRINRAATRYVKNHRASIHETLWVLSISLTMFELVNPYRHSPKWHQWLPTQIPPSKEEVVAAATAVCSRVMVFSDGSGHYGHIGATGVLSRDGKRRVH